MTEQTIIETLAGVPAGSAMAAAYARRADARAQSELSYQLLLNPAIEGPVTLAERRAVAAFIAGLYNEPKTRVHYAVLLADAAPARVAAIEAAITEGAQSGPWGTFPAGPLTAENTEGTPWLATAERAGLIGPRLAAGLAHAHMLALHPRDAAPGALQALLDAGWDEDGIVVLSQLVAFLSFQIRVIAGFAALATTRASA